MSIMPAEIRADANDVVLYDLTYKEGTRYIRADLVDAEIERLRADNATLQDELFKPNRTDNIMSIAAVLLLVVLVMTAFGVLL